MEVSVPREDIDVLRSMIVGEEGNISSMDSLSADVTDCGDATSDWYGLTTAGTLVSCSANRASGC